MRSIIRAVFCVASIALLAGCQMDDARKYRKQGIGTGLYTSSLEERTRLLEIYLGYICYQAGLRVDQSDDGTYQCRDGGVVGRHWHVVVMQGLNDIDRRCDAYLAWLDNKRRSKRPKLQQVSALRTATEAIMGQVDAGTTALEVVGSAFGLLSSTITNRNSRLLFEIDGAAIQGIVYKSRSRYRHGITKISVQSRPEAIYRIREYLNLCLPHIIETEINDIITVEERTEGVTREPLLDPAVVASIPRDADAPAPPAPPARSIVKGATKGTIEETISFEDAKAIQGNLCVARDGDFGGSNSDTRQSIRVYEKEYLKKPNGIIDNARELKDLLLVIGPCIGHKLNYLNVFEKFTFPDTSAIQGLQRTINAVLEIKNITVSIGTRPKKEIEITGEFDSATRAAIAAIKKALNIVGSSANLENGALDDKSYDELSRIL